MHLNKSRLRFKPQKFSINSTNLTRFLNQNQVTSYSSKLAVATMPSVKKAEKQSNNNTRTDQVRNWYFNSTTSYWIKKTANVTRQTNSTSHYFTKQMNYKIPTTKRAFFWYLKNSNLSNQTDFIYLNENEKNRTRVVNSLTHLNNIALLENQTNVTHLYQVHKPRHHISSIVRPLKRKINRLIRLMKFVQKSLPLAAPNSTAFINNI